ncbi:hypothetical protein AVEN_232729-1 [Araneus ventricosus]|uniref:Uncharacterized protein n=1 Tax=Araneus ventricosus TaxID=182803 RepID=A0A4Y2HH12_ARAVE|nr:hypothetical protein AVEN_232729-1 [Araneus ventricosus]
MTYLQSPDDTMARLRTQWKLNLNTGPEQLPSRSHRGLGGCQSGPPWLRVFQSAKMKIAPTNLPYSETFRANADPYRNFLHHRSGVRSSSQDKREEKRPSFPHNPLSTVGDPTSS